MRTIGFLREHFSNVNKKIHRLTSELEKDKIKDILLNIYLNSPPKLQFVLAKYVMKAILNKKQRHTEELIRH